MRRMNTKRECSLGLASIKGERPRSHSIVRRAVTCAVRACPLCGPVKPRSRLEGQECQRPGQFSDCKSAQRPYTKSSRRHHIRWRTDPLFKRRISSARSGGGAQATGSDLFTRQPVRGDCYICRECPTGQSGRDINLFRRQNPRMIGCCCARRGRRRTRRVRRSRTSTSSLLFALALKIFSRHGPRPKTPFCRKDDFRSRSWKTAARSMTHAHKPLVVI